MRHRSGPGKLKNRFFSGKAVLLHLRQYSRSPNPRLADAFYLAGVLSGFSPNRATTSLVPWITRTMMIAVPVGAVVDRVIPVEMHPQAGASLSRRGPSSGWRQSGSNLSSLHRTNVVAHYGQASTMKDQISPASLSAGSVMRVASGRFVSLSACR